MTNPEIDLKNPWIAGVLAFLVPGAGHLYQRRLFKGVLYFVCVLGTYLYGMSLGEWKVVAASQDVGDPRDPDHPRVHRLNVAYIAQFSVGSVSLPAYLQNRRYFAADNLYARALEEPIQSDDFVGNLYTTTPAGEIDITRITGSISLEPTTGEYGRSEVQGKFTGKNSAGEPLELALQGQFEFGPPVHADPRRLVRTFVPGEPGGLNEAGAQIVGTIPRNFKDHFAVPLDAQTKNRLHHRLGKRFEIAMVFTWIAGFLNILVIWDALEGPAYGYGDEEEEKKTEEKKESPPAAEPTT